MKSFTQKFIVLFSLLVSSNLYSQCDLPQPFTGNTGSNMTVFLTSDVISSLPISSASPYIVALNAEGLVCGSESLASENLIGGQQTIAVWGDDTSTPEVDGALANEEITFQLVDGNSLYDLSLGFLGVNSFVTNGQLPAISVTYSLACDASEDISSNISGCTDASAFNYNIDATNDDGSCIAIVMGCMDPSAFNYNASANTDDGSCVEFVYGCMFDWADNYNDYDGDGISNSLTGIDGIDVNTDDGSCFREGCMWSIADNYDLLATIDDGSCFKTGCMSEWADNYDIFATDDNGSCFIQLNEEEYQSLTENSQGSSDCEEIVIDIQEGWNIFGYTSSQIVDIGEVMAPYDDYIYIIKDNNGSQYWPANDYNGIGNFIPGGGYQIKAYESFSISF